VSAEELVRLLAQEGTFAPIPRTFPAYAADRLIGRRYADFELPRFHPDGWGEGLTERFSSLLSGQRPAVLFFFSSTCKHCQIDVPQLVKLLADSPDLYDVVGITRIKDERHRNISADYFEQQGITFPVLEDVGAVSELYRVSSTPTTFYLSPTGRITKTTYYQHQDLAGDYLKYHGTLMGAPPPPPATKDRGWHFPLKVTDPAGKLVDLESLQGKPSLLHFWATWCKPCREELPGLLRRLPALESEARVLFVSVDEEPAAIAKYQESSGLRFASHHSPAGGLAEEVDFARSVPRTYVLDPHGRVSKVLAGSYDWDDPHRFSGVLGRLAE
jgi:thiol-disulfide isomerase/thioredoxin